MVSRTQQRRSKHCKGSLEEAESKEEKEELVTGEGEGSMRRGHAGHLNAKAEESDYVRNTCL